LDLELLLVGEGEERPQLQELIDRLGRADRIRLLGHRTDVPEILEALDVFALSSLDEGLPNVVLEAMALEVPVAATRVGAVPRVITDNVNGLLVAPGDVEELTRVLARLLADAGLRRRLCEGGRKTVETRFSFVARVDKVRAIYDDMLRSVSPRMRGQSCTKSGDRRP
jgi:glycosyltransferase involved in cell wall biosynthesis